METEAIDTPVKNIFSMKEVLADSVRVYKEGFKPIIMLSIISFLLNICEVVLNNIQTTSLLDSKATFYYQILLFVIAVSFDFYIYLRLVISTYILADHYYDGINYSMGEALSKSRKLYWRFLGINILFGLMALLPTAGAVFCYFYIKEVVAKFIGVGLFCIPAVILYIRYGFASISGVLIKEKHRYFDLSQSIVKGSFWKVLILLTITEYVFYMPYQIFTRVLINPRITPQWQLLTAQILNLVILLFALPFSYIVMVVMYRKLLALNNLTYER